MSLRICHIKGEGKSKILQVRVKRMSSWCTLNINDFGSNFKTRKKHSLLVILKNRSHATVKDIILFIAYTDTH